jgi:hypothetical protein
MRPWYSANLNLHAHVLVLDGVFAPAEQGRLTFAARPPERDERPPISNEPLRILDDGRSARP